MSPKWSLSLRFPHQNPVQATHDTTWLWWALCPLDARATAISLDWSSAHYVTHFEVMFLDVRSTAGMIHRQNVACSNAGFWYCIDLPVQYTSATVRQCWRCARSCTNANRTSCMRTADVMVLSISKCANHRPHRMAATRVAGVKGKQRLEWLINDKWSVQHEADLWRSEWHWEGVYWQYFEFPLSVPFHHCTG